jgi:hypothetical protein
MSSKRRRTGRYRIFGVLVQNLCMRERRGGGGAQSSRVSDARGPRNVGHRWVPVVGYAAGSSGRTLLDVGHDVR